MEPESCKGTFIPAVDRDRITKDSIRRTMRNQLVIWPSKWSFLIDEYKKMHEAMEGKRLLSPYDWSRHMSSKSSPPDKTKETKESIFLPPIPPMPEKHLHLPQTSNRWYGYKPLRDGRNLVSDRQQWTKTETFQHDLIKNLKWPIDHWD